VKWQTRVKALVKEVGGLVVTSGYRSPEHNAEIGGAPGSYHTKGSKAFPGALDVGGGRAQLIDLCHRVEAEFEGRINELYLNVYGPPHWYAVKNDKHLNRNPERGKGQHLHIALRDE
jgi:hypothetical protein